MPSTLMGQFMEALNSQTNLDDLNLNIDSFQGGLECNVDEVINRFHCDLFDLRSKSRFCKSIFFDNNKRFHYISLLFSFFPIPHPHTIRQLIQQELNIDGLLDINIPISTHYTGSHLNQTQNTSIGLPLPQTSDATKLHSVQSTTQSAGVTSPSWVH